MFFASVLALAGAQSSFASPLVSIGDSADLFFNGSASVKSTSNVYKNATNEEDDLIFELTPGFEVNVGRGASEVDLSLLTKYTIRRYSSEDDQDTELFSTRLTGSYKGSRLSTKALMSFAETKSNSGDVNAGSLIESDNIALSVGGEYIFSPKFSFGVEVKYEEREYTGQSEGSSADYETVTIPLDLFYELTPKVDLSAGYTFQDRTVGATRTVSSYDQENHFFNVGARGEFTPKLSGSFKVGLRTADNDARTVTGFGVVEGEDGSTLGTDASLTFRLSPKLDTVFKASRDFSSGSAGQSVENTLLSLTGTYTINANYSATAGFKLNQRDYDTNRDDDQLGFNVRLKYEPNDYWKFSGGYRYDDNDSNQNSSDYTEHLFDFAASLRY